MGTIEFRDYRTRYREGLDLVLKGVTFSIGPGEKVYVSENSVYKSDHKLITKRLASWVAPGLANRR